MGLRERFFRNFGTNGFSGVTLGSWLQVLRDNGFSIDAPFWPRAALTTLNAFPNTLAAWLEQKQHGAAIERTEVLPPLFILGGWRSGTTHLHNLLSIDERFAFPNLYQITYPLTFLLSERSTAWLVDLLVPKRRPQDAVRLGVKEPQEEEFALCSLTGQASLMAWAFSRNAAFYDRFMTMCGLSAEERSRWNAGYMFFVKKLTYKYGRPLVLKSPANTGRIKALLELFPDAKFVHIHRNPYDIFPSSVHTLRTAGPWRQLQRMNFADDDGIHTQMIEQFKTLYDGYFAQASLIPPGRLHQVAYADLERDPIGELRKTYEALDLPDFSKAEPAVQTYLASLRGYKKNSFTALPTAMRERIYREWQPYFDEWKYAA